MFGMGRLRKHFADLAERHENLRLELKPLLALVYTCDLCGERKLRPQGEPVEVERDETKWVNDSWLFRIYPDPKPMKLVCPDCAAKVAKGAKETG